MLTLYICYGVQQCELCFILLYYTLAVLQRSMKYTEDEQRALNQMSRFVSLKTNVATGTFPRQEVITN
jgi:hypothetical protein